MGDDIIDEARKEFFAQDGVLSTSTYMRLSNAGYNADAIIEQFESEDINDALDDADLRS